MSADEIFAAQMWVWPDPMLKRDMHGRVMVVNAAFLGIYGGTVEDWHGNSVSGWPEPQGPGQSTRFESRLPLPDGTELIYDWIETSLQDGSALAIARDVTAYAAAPVNAHMPAQSPDAQTQHAQTQRAEAQPAKSHHTEPQQADQQNQEPQDTELGAPAAEMSPEIPRETSGETSAPDRQDSLNAAPHDGHSHPSQTQSHHTDTNPAHVDTADDYDAYALSAAEAEHLAQQNSLADPSLESSQAPAPESPPESAAVPNEASDTPPPTAEEAPRDFERRALPIEDGDAVLGNNWRDAVIARAVGASDAEPETSQVPAGDNGKDTASEAEPAGTGIRVLLAEDNAINALLTRTLLEAEGCVVDVVEDGSLAVEAVKKAPYHMIFMDMRMPNMDGLEATRKIRATDHLSKGLPIVALTANAFDDDRNACFDSGMNDFMTKPVSAEELSQMVKTHTTKADEEAA